MIMAVKHWHGLPREVDAPSLETLKVRLDRALSTWWSCSVPVHCRGVGLGGLSRSLPTQYYYSIMQSYSRNCLADCVLDGHKYNTVCISNALLSFHSLNLHSCSGPAIFLFSSSVGCIVKFHLLTH